jgi:hypothetical protein
MLRMFLALLIPLILFSGFLTTMIALTGTAAGNSSIPTTTTSTQINGEYSFKLSITQEVYC